MKRKRLTDEDARLMQAQLKVGVELANHLQLRAYFACAIFITHLLNEEPPGPPSHSSSSSSSAVSEKGTKKTLLDRVIDNQTFMFALGRLLFYGEPMKQKASTSQSPDAKVPSPSESAYKAYRLFQEMTGLQPLKTNSSMGGIAVSRLSEMAKVPVQSALRSHYRNCDVSIVFNGELLKKKSL
jgi:hypothetical protein